MNTKAIFDFIKELSLCDYTPSWDDTPIEVFSYNGVSYAQSTETYQSLLENLFVDFKASVLEIKLNGGDDVLKSVKEELLSVNNKFYDVPSAKDIERMRLDYNTTKSASLRKSIQEVEFLVAMNDLQRYYTNEAIKYLGASYETVAKEEVTSEPSEAEEKEPKSESDDKVISSTEGLAKFLGCSKSIAFAIIKSRILVKNKIQYKVGNCWKFNRKKLEKLLEENPEMLKNIHCTR